MKNALISPNETVSYLSGWTDSPKPKPIYTTIPNAERVAEVANTTFEVAPPLFWVACADDIVADLWYYDTATKIITPVPASPPYPTPLTNG
jgi:hypothetical protein